MKAQKFTTDTLLLFNFLTSKIKPGEKILDIGCSDGELDFMLAQQYDVELTGIDIDESSISKARLRIDNEKQGRIVFKNSSLEVFSKINSSKNAFSRIITNPPFYKTGASRSSPDEMRTAARLDSLLPISDIFKFASRLLINKGALDFIFPAFRINEIITLANETNFAVLEIKPVYTKADHYAKRILIECGKNVRGETRLSYPILPM